MKTIFEELELVMRNNQELKSHKDKNQITTKNDDAKDANV
jgi:hypothetical protein